MIGGVSFRYFDGECYAETARKPYGRGEDKYPISILPNQRVFSIEVHIMTESSKKQTNHQDWATIVGRENFGLCVNDGYLCFWYEGKEVTTTAKVNDKKEHRITLVSNEDGSIDLYCNRVNVAHTENINMIMPDCSLYIGCSDPSNLKSFLTMVLYEIRFWSIALNSSQIYSYNIPFVRFNYSKGKYESYNWRTSKFDSEDPDWEYDVPHGSLAEVHSALYSYWTNFGSHNDLPEYKKNFEFQFLPHCVGDDEDAEGLIIADNGQGDLVCDIAIGERVTKHFDILLSVLYEVNFSPTNLKDDWEDSEETISAMSFDSNEIERNVSSERNTSGTQSVEINIAEQQLTDQVTFTSIIQYAIMQYIGGQYFDYLYKLRIESRTQQGILFTYRCCSNIDELLYTQIAYKVTSTETIQDDTQEQSSEEEKDKTIEEEEAALLETGEYHTLTENAVAVATYFGLTPVVQLGEFAEFYSSYKEQDLWGRTYADAIREVFGWSSRIPHKLINVYIRDDKMFFIQRGSESNVIDITPAKHTVPIVNQELVRTFWGTTQWSQTEIKEKILGTRGLGGSGDSDNDDFPADYINNDDDDDKDNPWSAVGTVTTSDSAGTSVTKYDYTSNGVLRGTTTTFTSNADSSQNSTTVVRNSYNADGLLEAVQTTVTHPDAPEEDKQTVVKYGYLSLSGGQKFLASELTAEYERNSEGFFELVDTKATTKSPTGRGQGTSYDSKGKGTASGNVGDDRVTPYQLRSAFNTTAALSVQTLKKTTTTTINGFTDIDPSFPLLLLRDRAIITEYLKWLNRKTKETVSVSVYDFGHIIDFNDRIILDGKEYFVVNNTIRTTPRVYNEQNLRLARWF